MAEGMAAAVDSYGLPSQAYVRFPRKFPLLILIARFVTLVL
jgi:hypothetical protein